MEELNAITQNLQPLSKVAGPAATMGTPSADAPAFDQMLTGFLKDVNHMQNYADQSIQKMVAGEVKDVHQVMLAVGEAKVAFNLMLEIRNKTLEAYNELVKMRG